MNKQAPQDIIKYIIQTVSIIEKLDKQNENREKLIEIVKNRLDLAYFLLDTANDTLNNLEK